MENDVKNNASHGELLRIGDCLLDKQRPNTSFRISIFLNGHKTGGKAIFVYPNECWETFVARCTVRLSCFKSESELNMINLYLSSKRDKDENGNPTFQFSDFVESTVIGNAPEKQDMVTVDIVLRRIRVYNCQGGEIDSIELLCVDDKVYIAYDGEPFCTPRAECNKNFNAGEISYDDWVTLNVGGRLFSTTRSTLCQEAESMLARMFDDHTWRSHRDKQGAFLIDRSPEYFAPLLHYLRTQTLLLDDGLNVEAVLQEAAFFGLQTIVEPLKQMVERRRVQRETSVLSRKEFLSILLTSSVNSSLRCQGLDFAGVDLSRLDLSHINFRMTNFHRANLERANLDHAQLQEAFLSDCNLQFASLRGANLGGANLENANLRGANLEDRGGIKASLEGAKLKGARLEDCNFSGANLRAANLRGCNLENANLRRADLAGADLEGVNLRGANLNKANLFGANLTDVNFDIRTTTPWG